MAKTLCLKLPENEFHLGQPLVREGLADWQGQPFANALIPRPRLLLTSGQVIRPRRECAQDSDNAQHVQPIRFAQQ